MAATAARKLLFKCNLAGKPCNPTLSIGVRLLSSELHPIVDVKKLCSNCGPFPWKLYAAVCVVRLPIAGKGHADDMTLNYAAMRRECEFKNDILSNWSGIEQQRQQLLEGFEFGQRNLGSRLHKEIEQDLEENEALFEKYKNSQREIALEKDFGNRNRKPRDSLILIIKQQLGNDAVWMLPKEEWREGEDLRESATRALERHCYDLPTHFVSNSPCGFYKHKFPRGARNDTRVGAKLFIHKAFVQENAEKGNFSFQSNVAPVLGHAWVAKDEMRKFMKPKYIAAIDNIVF